MCGVAVLDRGGGDDDAEQQAVHIHGEVPLDAVRFLGAIPAAAGSGHGVGGGYRLRVDDRRGRAPVPPGPHPQSVGSASRMRCHAPLRAQRAKTAYTVAAGGNSTGSCRHAIPPRTMCRMASTIARRQCFSGRPPRPAVLPGAGNSGSRIAHCASVTDDEYTAQPCPRAAWGGHDGHGEIGVDGIVGSWSGRGLGNHRPNQEPTSSGLREAHAHRSRFPDLRVGDDPGDELLEALIPLDGVDASLRRIGEHFSAGADHVAIMPLPTAHDPFPVLEEFATKLQP